MLAIKSNLQPKVSPTIALNQKVKELQAAGEKVFNMSIGENRFPPHNQLVELMQKHANKVTYSDPQGIVELRKAVVAYYFDRDIKTTEKNIIISPGSKAAIFILMLALEGDLMLIRPSWVSYEPQAEHAGKKVKWIDTKFENNHVPSAQEIKKAYDQAKESGMNPKILILNYPNNPTSYMASISELKIIIDTCKELGITLISDELYCELCYESEYNDPSKIYPEGVIVVGGISKFLSVAGWRIGWIRTPMNEEGEKLAAILKALASDVWSNVSTNIQYAVAEFLAEGKYKEFINQNKNLHSQRNKFIATSLNKIGIDTIEPNGGFYVFANFEKYRQQFLDLGIENGYDLQNYLLGNYKIACLSAANFGDLETSLSVRMSTSFLDANTPDQAQKLFEVYLKSKSREAFVNERNHPELYEVIENIRQFINCSKKSFTL
jgi:aspartate aminotransferase